jgi:hypothetical protein
MTDMAEKYLTIPGSGPGAGLMVAKGDFVMLAKGDWHEVDCWMDTPDDTQEIVTTEGLTIDPASVLAVRLPSEMNDPHGEPPCIDDGSCDPLYGQRMDSADMGEN